MTESELAFSLFLWLKIIQPDRNNRRSPRTKETFFMFSRHVLGSRHLCILCVSAFQLRHLIKCLYFHGLLDFTLFNLFFKIARLIPSS